MAGLFSRIFIATRISNITVVLDIIAIKAILNALFMFFMAMFLPKILF